MLNDETEDQTLLSSEEPVDPQAELLSGLRDFGSKLLPEDTENRAAKFQLAFGEQSPTRDEIVTELEDGREDILRDNLTRYDKIKRNETTKRLLLDNIEAGNLDQMPEILPDLVTGMEEYKDPGTILEEQYIYKGNDWIRAYGVAPEIAEVEATDPMGYDAVTNPYELQAIRNELVNTKYEELKAKTDALGWGEWGWEVGKQMLELPSWTNMILDSDDKVQTESLLPGNNIMERVTALHALPADRFKAALDAEIDWLYQNNPLDARDFIQAMQQYSYTDSFYRNAFALSVIPMGTMAKTVTKAGKAAVTTKTVQLGKGTTMELSGSKEAVEKAAEEATAGEVAKAAILKEAAKEGPYRPTRQDWTDEPFTIKEVDEMPPGNEGSMGVMFYNPSGHQIFINPKDIEASFKRKGWSKGISGSRPLPEDSFASAEEYKDFIIQHEIAHIDNPKIPADSKFGLSTEDWTNINALARMGRTDLLVKIFPEVYPNMAKEMAKKDAAKAAQDINQAINIPGTTLDEVAVNSGLVQEASEMVAQADLARGAMADTMLGAAPVSIKEQAKNLLAKTTSFANPRLYITGAESLAGARVNDLLAMTNLNKLQIDGMMTANMVSRIPGKALEVAFAKTLEDYKTYGKYVEDTLMDVKQIAPEMSPINAPFLELTHGTLEKLPFDHRGTAYNAAIAMGMKPGTFRVTQQGNGYLIKTFKAVDETEQSVWDSMMSLDNIPRNNTWTYIKTLTGANTSVSPFQRLQRATASQGQTNYEAVLRSFYEPLSKLTGLMNKRTLKQLDKVMHLNRMTERIPGDKTTRGMFYENRAQLDAAYQQLFKRNATDAEEDAYAAFVRGSDLDYIFRSLSEYKRKSIKGIEEVKLTVRRETKDGVEYNDFPFEGKVIKEPTFLNSDHDIDFLYIDRNGTASRKSLRSLPEPERQDYIDQIKDGAIKIVQPNDPRSSKVGKLYGSDTPMAYILTHDIKARNPLKLDEQVNYRQGFHNEYKANWFLKQAKVAQKRFEGDTTALAGMSQKQLQKAAKHWEKARQLLEAKKQPEFEAYVRQNLDMTPGKFASFFDEGHLSLHDPFVVVKRGTRSFDSGNILENGQTFSARYGDINNDLDRYHNLSSDFGDPFTSSRDPEVFGVTGDESNPLWGVREADQFSPMYTQTKAMGNLIKSTFYNDLQLTSAMNYVEAFKGKLMYDGVPVSDIKLRSNPIFYMANASIDALNNPKAAVQAWTLRTHMKNLLGEPSITAKALDIFKTKLLDGVYTTAGQKGLDLVPETMIPMLNDPFQYARNIAFHSKLGMFNPVQLFVQGMAVNNVVLISPKAGSQSFVGTSLMHRLQLTEDPAIISKFGDYAESIGLGWNKQKFVEAKNLLDSTAFDRVGGEVSFRSTSGDPNIYRGPTGSLILDKGPVFFNAGERLVRLTGWNTAYLEWAAKNPSKVGKATRSDTQWILDRAKVFSSNMTRDSNSFWQTGLAGNFTQFWSYNVRMAELMIGKQLSGPEKARLVMGNMLLYGFTPAAGIAAAIEEGDVGYINAAVNPWAEDLRIYAMKNGHDMDQSMAGALYKGMYSLGIEQLFGAKLGFGERYGMSPLQVFNTVQENYKEYTPFWATVISLMGPSGNISADIITSAIPIAKDLNDIVQGNIPDGAILQEDIQQAFKEISGISNGYKIYAILNSQNYLSKKGNLQIEGDADMNKVKEVIKAVTGLTEVSDLDAYKMLEDSKKMDKDRNLVRQEAKRYMALFYSYTKQGRSEEAEAFKVKAQILLSAEYMTNQSRMEILFPPGAMQTEAAELLERDWLGKLPPEERQKAKEMLDRRALEESGAEE